MKDPNGMSLSEFRDMPFWTEPESDDQLRKFCSMLQDKLGLTVLYMDCTLEDVARFGSGVKVVVPQMQPISVPESLKWLAHPRLSRHADRHSLKFAGNLYPHPFP